MAQSRALQSAPFTRQKFYIIVQIVSFRDVIDYAIYVGTFRTKREHNPI